MVLELYLGLSCGIEGFREMTSSRPLVSSTRLYEGAGSAFHRFQRCNYHIASHTNVMGANMPTKSNIQ